jgi:hypothetical protein
MLDIEGEKTMKTVLRRKTDALIEPVDLDLTPDADILRLVSVGHTNREMRTCCKSACARWSASL